MYLFNDIRYFYKHFNCEIKNICVVIILMIN